MIKKHTSPVKLERQKRTYYFPGNEKVELENVTELIVTESGNHRLKTADDKLHIIPPGWIHIEIYDQTEWNI